MSEEKDVQNYLVKVNIFTTTDTGKDKIEKKEILIEGAKDISHANDLAFKSFATSGQLRFSIVTVTESKISEIIPAG